MLIYLHGFNSAPASHKAQQLRAALAARGLALHWRCPALPGAPAAAIACAARCIVETPAALRPITLVGSSLGGFYATYLAERYDLRAVLLNPAVRPQHELEAYLGPQRNLYTGATWELTAAHIAQWRALDVAHVRPERYLLIVETDDAVLDHRVALDKYAGARQIVVAGGDHALQSFPRHIDEILRFAGLAHV